MKRESIVQVLGSNAFGRARWWQRVTLAALVMAPAVVSASTPAGCDVARPGVAHGAGGNNPQTADAVPCLTYTFYGYGETNVAVTSNGTVMHGGSYDPNHPASNVSDISGNVARSVDAGATWQFVPQPGRRGKSENRGAGDPLLWRDPLTDRVFFTSIGSGELTEEAYGDQGLCDTEISYTDDGGATWIDHPNPPNWGCPAFDFPQLFTGPPRNGETMPTSYPNVLYICKSSHAMPDRQCWKSLDSAVTLTEVPGSGGHDPRTVGIDGIVYGVVGSQLHWSSDEMATWNVGAAVAPFGGRPVVDGAGNVYLVGTVGNKVQVTYTSDRGATWSLPIDVQMPGVNHVHEPAIAVPATGAPGTVAVAYIGNGDASDVPNVPPTTTGGPHHGYITWTRNIFAADPVFRSVQVDSAVDPLLPYGFPAIANTSGTPSRADYIGVFVDDVGEDAGTPWAGFFKDMCALPGMCQRPNPDPLTTNWFGAVATVAPLP